MPKRRCRCVCRGSRPTRDPVGDKHLARLRQRQEHIVFGVRHRDDGAAVADAAGPAGDMGDVENRIAAVQGRRVGLFPYRVIRTQDQVGHTDVDPAM